MVFAVSSAEFEIVTAVGGERALEILESQSEVAVIISDMRMPRCERR